MSEETEAQPIASTLEDGSMRVLVHPSRRLQWHRPRVYVPPLQWRPETGMTRYEWARQHTPKNQVPFFQHLRRIYRSRTPKPLPLEIAKEMADASARLDNGMIGYAPEDMAKFEEYLNEYEIQTTDPTGEWRFHITADYWRDVLCDRLHCSCRDYRTLPDWEMLVRLRSWVIEDDREAFIWLPDQDANREHFGPRYENIRFNSLQMICPRRVQPDGTKLDTGNIRPYENEVKDLVDPVEDDSPSAETASGVVSDHD